MVMKALSEVCGKFPAEGAVLGGDTTQPNTTQNELGGDFWQETLQCNIRVRDHFIGEKQVSQREHWSFLRVEDTQIFYGDTGQKC